MLTSNNIHHASSRLLILCGIWLTGLGIYFIFFRPALLPEDVRFMSANLTQIKTTLPGIEKWLQKVFIVMGGFIAGVGVLTYFLAKKVMPLRLGGTSWIIAISGGSSVMLMSVINFVLRFYFSCQQ